MKVKLYLRCDYADEANALDISDEEYIRMLDREYGGVMGTTDIGKPTVAYESVSDDGTRWDSCEAELLNDRMGNMTVDEMVTHCVHGEGCTCVVRPNTDRMGELFEESYKLWVHDSEAARKTGTDMPRIQVGVAFPNLAGETVWAMMDECWLYGMLNDGRDAIVSVFGMRFADELTNLYKDTDG